MPITKAGIEALGFTEMPPGTVITAYFTYTLVFSVEGISHQELTSEHFSDTSYFGDEFSFAFGSNVNEVSKKMCNEYTIDDEIFWAKKHQVEPPYFIISFTPRNPFSCSAGYWKEFEGKLLTYDCFSEAKRVLRKMENKTVPSLLRL